MILHCPTVSRADGEVCVSARVELQRAELGLPETLWFSFPEDHAPLVSERADGFVVSLVLLAMALGEDMEVRGSLSPRLAYGLQEYQRFFHAMMPEAFRLIRIEPQRLQPPQRTAVPSGVACAFSGGVDSFFTLWHHLPQNQPLPEFRLTHCLFVHGFDIPLAEKATFETCRQAYQKLLERLGVTLLSVRTNVRRFLARLDWHLAHGPALIGAALMLENLLGKFLVPGGYTYVDWYWDGSDPRINHLPSTETLRVIHHGADGKRVDKVAVVAHWPETYAALRVCWERFDGLNNCCQCEKCIRTMLALEIEGALDRYETFPLPLNARSFQALRARYHTFHRSMPYYLRAARTKERRDMLWLLYREALLGYALIPPLWATRKVLALFRLLRRR